MNKLEYFAWCWDNRKIFTNNLWENFYYYNKRAFQQDVDDSCKHTLVQVNPVESECSYLKMVLTFNLMFDNSIFTDFSVTAFKGADDEEIDFIIENAGAQNLYILKRMGNSNSYWLDFRSNARELSELLKLLSSDLDFSVQLRGSNWTICSNIFGSLVNPSGVSQRLDDMILQTKKEFLIGVDYIKPFWAIYANEINFSESCDDFIAEIENFLLKDTGLTKNKNSYSYLGDRNSAYMYFVKSEIQKCKTDDDWRKFYDDIFYRLVEHRVVSSASIFPQEIKYLCEWRLSNFFGRDVNFQRVANVMNDIVGMEIKRKQNDTWLNNEDGRSE